jgi:hypothetical protein
MLEFLIGMFRGHRGRTMNKSVKSYGLRASLEVLEKKGLGD